jgi:hypothetical protein
LNRVRHWRKGGPALIKSLRHRAAISPRPTSPQLLLRLDPVALGTEFIDLAEHAVEQRLDGSGGYACALELPDLMAVSVNLRTHAHDFTSDELDCRHHSIRTTNKQMCKPEHESRAVLRDQARSAGLLKRVIRLFGAFDAVSSITNLITVNVDEVRSLAQWLPRCAC